MSTRIDPNDIPATNGRPKFPELRTLKQGERPKKWGAGGRLKDLVDGQLVKVDTGDWQTMLTGTSDGSA
ncbi:MAG: hypothetical protein HY047_00470 [Acidobacteria bacterium]|nr:hypothetical protein [Acidobacteriota bacterium]